MVNMRILAVMLVLSLSELAFAAQGFIERDGSRMEVVDTFAVLDKADGKLSIYLLPSKVTDAEKTKIMSAGLYSSLGHKVSPDPTKWSWYPYARLVFSNNNSRFASRNDLGRYFLMAYGIKKKNSTQSLNGNIKFDSNVVLDKYEFNGKRVRIQFRGKDDSLKIHWLLDITSELQ